MAGTHETQTIFFGANDISFKDTTGQHVPLHVFEENLRRLIKHPRVQAHGNIRILLITPPPIDEWGFDHWDEPGRTARKAATARQYAAGVRKVGKEMSVAVVDLWTACMEEATVGWSASVTTERGVEPILPGDKRAERSDVLARLLYDGMFLMYALGIRPRCSTDRGIMQVYISAVTVTGSCIGRSRRRSSKPTQSFALPRSRLHSSPSFRSGSRIMRHGECKVMAAQWSVTGCRSMQNQRRSSYAMHVFGHTSSGHEIFHFRQSTRWLPTFTRIHAPRELTTLRPSTGFTCVFLSTKCDDTRSVRQSTGNTRKCIPEARTLHHHVP